VPTNDPGELRAELEEIRGGCVIMLVTSVLAVDPASPELDELVRSA
jgi:hypothetical protein